MLFRSIVEDMRGFEIDHEPDGWPAIQMRQISALCDEIDRLREDEKRLDWLADKDNEIGNVQLPERCVIANLHSLRAAIDMAMLLPSNAGGKRG